MLYPAKPKPKSFSLSKFILITILVIVLVLIGAVAFVFFFPNNALSMVNKLSARPPDKSLVKISKQEVLEQQENITIETKILQNLVVAKKTRSEFTSNFTEKQVLTSLAKTPGGLESIEYISLSFKENNIKGQISAQALITGLKNTETKEQNLIPTNLDPKSLDNLYLTMEAAVNNDSKITITQFDTGNSLVDSLIPAQSKQMVEKNLNLAISNLVDDSNYVLSKIEIKEGLVFITYSPKPL
jgi:hypothetical protein